MTRIIRSDLTISGTYKFADNVQVAPGVTITVKPGAILDFGGYALLNLGTLSLEGNADALAIVQNGSYSTEGAKVAFNSAYGHVKDLKLGSFSSDGALVLDRSLVENSHIIPPLRSNIFSQSVIMNSQLDFGMAPGTISQTTFFHSPFSISTQSSLYPQKLNISASNFVGTSPVIELLPPYSVTGVIHSVNIRDSYVQIPFGSNFEAMVYDATDDLKVTKDLQASDFLTQPITNSNEGFTVGPYTLSLNALQTGVNGQGTPLSSSLSYQLSVVVDKGVLAVDAVLLKGLTERITFKDGLLASHTVTYGNTTYDYAQIDGLIMTVTRNDTFTDEFRQEILDFAPSAFELTHSDAIILVGKASMDDVILRVAGADGYFVG